MGRKADYAEKPKKGPGKKTKKQQPPTFTKSSFAPGLNENDKKLTHRQKQRVVKRVNKKQLKKQKTDANKLTIKAKYQSESEQEVSENDSIESSSEDETNSKVVKGFTDDNQSWLKPKQSNGKKQEEELGSDGESDEDMENDDSNINPEEDESDANEDEDESIEEDEDDDSDSEKLKVGKLDDLSDDEDDKNSDDDFDIDSVEENSDDDEKLPIEKANKKLKKRQEEETKLADAEMQMSVDKQHIFQFPDDNEEEDEENPVTLQEVQQRIKDISLVLSDFKKYRQEGRSRYEYIDLLKKDLCLYYSYNDYLMTKLMDMFALNELMEYLESSEVARPLTIRTNSLKTRRRDLAGALINRGVNLDPLGKWTKVGLVIFNSQVPLGATPEYLAGHYMIQGASSMLPVQALAPQENERILDMCSAPGGKSSHISAIMKNTGVLFANDANRDRIKAVVANFHRLGVINAIVSCEDGCKFKNVMSGFDRILLDAPCSGTGVVSKDPSVKTTKSEIDVQRCYNLQRKLLLSAIDCLDAKSATGGYLVYSTCSVLPEENEWVVEFALKKRNVKLVSTGLDFGTEGFVNYRQFRFHPSMNLTRRYYPHTHNMDGFFIAKFKKFSNTIPVNQDNEEEELAEKIEEVSDPMENETSELKKIKKRSGKPELSEVELEIKRKKKTKDEKKYVANVFEKPEKKVKKIKILENCETSKETVQKNQTSVEIQQNHKQIDKKNELQNGEAKVKNIIKNNVKGKILTNLGKEQNKTKSPNNKSPSKIEQKLNKIKKVDNKSKGIFEKNENDVPLVVSQKLKLNQDKKNQKKLKQVGNLKKTKDGQVQQGEAKKKIKKKNI